MNKHLAKLPPFKSLLTPEQRAEFEALSDDQRKAFVHAFVTGILIRDDSKPAESPAA